VRSGRHGHALDGAEIAVYAGSRAGEAVDRLVTDATGRASWSPPQVTPSPQARHGQWQLLIRHDGEQVVHDRWARHRLPHVPEARDLVLLYTDRSVYRPQQEVLWKAVVYRPHLDEHGDVERYAARVGVEVTMRLVDANSQTVAEETVTTGDFGSASGRFTVPAGRVLGSWTLQANDDGRAWIQVEEYKRPTFEVSFRDPTTALRLNRDAELVGEARYYFGLPVTEGRVRWRVERTPVWPYWWFWNRPRVTSRTIATGESELDAAGQFRVGFLAEADERLAADDGGVNPWRDVGYRYEISADVTSEGGETRSAERMIHLGFVAVDARIDAATGFTRAGEATRLTIRRTRLDGQPAAGAGQWTVHRLDQPEATPLPADLPPGLRPAWAAPEPVDPYVTEGDRRSERWQSSYDAARLLATWPNGEAVASGQLIHAEDGLAELAIDLDAGAYRVVYRTEDPFGAVIERAEELLVVGEAPVRLPAVLELERSSVEVGETARILIHSGLSDQSALLEILHAGEVIDRRPVTFSSSDEATPRIVELPITRAHRGGLGVRLIVVRDHQLLNPMARLDVPWNDRVLDVTFDTFRDHLRPGQNETWSVTVRRADGEPVGAEAAEVLAYMFDRGLDLFSPHDPPSIDGLYPSGSWIRQIETPFRMAQQLHRSDDWPEIAQPPRLRDDLLNLFSRWSIGGPGLRHRPLTMRMAKTAAGNTALMAEETMEVVDEAAVVDERQASAAMAVTMTADASPPSPPPPSPSPPPPATGAEPAVRTDFAETAFWLPDLRTDADGAVRFEFRVPDSVTDWHVWVHALTRDLHGGRLHRNARTSKELLVRPQMPRFLREGDQAELRVVVDNTGDTALDGSLSLDLSDPATGDDLAPAFGLDPAALDDVAFAVGPRESTTLRFSLVAPRRPGPASLTVRGRAGEWSDGERRPLPVLPSRLHLTRSRSAMLRGDETADGRRAKRVLDFGVDDPKAEDPSLEHDAFVVTVDGQLFTSVLRALPYLIDYPYECTEQTLNRYLASGLMTRLFDDHPSVGKLAARLAESRDGRLEAWNPTDPNRRLLLEETPWLRRARGGGYWSHDRALIKILDPEIARQHRDATWRKLEAAQAADGSFSWWPGGPESTYKTLYVLEGLSRALEGGLDVPKPMVERAWSYIHRVAMANDPELRRLAHSFRNKTYIAWILSNYPDLSWTGGVFSEDDRRVLLDQISAGWSSLEPRIKLYATIALHRGGRVDEARMVLDSVLDSAITDPDLGTYWQPERLSWVWYRDTVETHAFALRTLVEVAPDDPRVHGLAQWLLLNKELSHWKSTRATSEAVYALTAYLEAIDGFDRRQTVRVAVAGDTQRFVFEPDETETRRRILFEGDDAVSPVFIEGEGRVEIASKSPGFVIATATWHFGTDQLPEVSDGDLFAVERAFFLRVPTDTGRRLEPLADGTPIAVGDEVEVQLTLTTRHAAEYVHLRDPRGAGFEPMVLTSGHDWSDGLWFYREVRDSGTNFFVERLPAGEVVLRHRLRASMSGTFRVGPATVQGMYAPEFAAHSSGVELTVED
ncbi:MAG: alpha-2-macroglobulin family protein, partial [Acidobacteriota bacterium]